MMPAQEVLIQTFKPFKTRRLGPFYLTTGRDRLGNYWGLHIVFNNKCYFYLGVGGKKESWHGSTYFMQTRLWLRPIDYSKF